MSEADSQSADTALNAAVVRISGEDGAIAGAGFLITPDRVLTCAHVVSDALDQGRHVEVAPGATVEVSFPLVDGAGWQSHTAKVEQWIPEAPQHCGDVAVLLLQAAVAGTRPLPLAVPEVLSNRQVRTVGFPDSELGLLWHRGQLSGKSSGDWIQLSRADVRTAHVTTGFSGGPVWDDELGAVVGVVVAAEDKRDDTQQAYAISVGAVLQRLRDVDRFLTPAAPFRGLDTFQESHEDIFFGRGKDIDRVVTALKGDQPSVILYGPSGCGKSSLALAGVVPRMREEDQDHCGAVVVNAGPSGSLRAGIANQLYEAVQAGQYGVQRAQSVDQVERWLEDLGLVDTLNRLRGQANGKYLIVFDQAEALLDRSEAEIEEAVGLLFLGAGASSDSRLLITLRSDFMDAMLKHPALGPLLADSRTLPLAPMSRDQLWDVINKPLEKAPAVTYDAGLAQRILDDACLEPENLPLLGFVLKQLWDKQYAGRLRTTVYDALHGVKGALEKHCNDAWEQCVGEAEKVAAARLLRGLVRVLPGSEAPLRRRLTREEAGEESWRLAGSFAKRRLLVLRGGRGEPETADLAHETLINVWPSLRRQVEEDSKFLTGRAELAHDRDRWVKGQHASELLPSAGELVAVQSWLKEREEELSSAEKEFLAVARRRQRIRSRLKRTAVVAVVITLALIASLGTFLVQQSRVSEQRQAEARSRTLAIRSDEVNDSDPGQAALTALAAYEVAPTQEARSAMMRRYQEQQQTAWLLSGAEGTLYAAAMSADGTVTLVTTETGRATLFVRDSHGQVRTQQLDLAQNVKLPVVSRDGHRIAYVRDTGGEVVWHEVTPDAYRLLGPAHRLKGSFDDISLAASEGMDDFKVLDFSPDARRLVATPAADSDVPVQVWDLATGRPHALSKRIPRLSEVWFGPDNDTLVATRQPAKGSGSLLTIGLSSATVRVLARGIESAGTSLSGDGRVASVCRKLDLNAKSNTAVQYQAVRLVDGTVLRSMREGEAWCSDTAIDMTGTHVAVGRTTEGGNEWHIFATADTKRPVNFLGPSTVDANGEMPLLGTPDNPVVFTKDDNAVRGWALQKTDSATAFSPPRLLSDGSTMVVRADRDAGRLRVIETEGDGKVISEVRTHAKIPPDANQPLAVNGAESLVADVSDLNHITVRSLPSLRRVADFETVSPPLGRYDKPDFDFQFMGENRLVTRSGSQVEYWDAASGRRLSPPVDLRALHLTRQPNPSFFVGPYFDPQYLMVTVQGDPYAYVVNQHTGRENRHLRLRLDDDVIRAIPMKDRRYVAIFTTGSMVELWSVPPPRQSGHKVVGPVGPVTQNRFTVGGPGGSMFFIADKDTVRFVNAADPDYQQTYTFGSRQAFLAATKDGKALLLTPPDGGPMTLFRLDPDLWKRHLCNVAGRNLSSSERSGLPPGLPAHICSF